MINPINQEKINKIIKDLYSKTSGIAIRITFLAWFVALFTLIIFVIITIPQQINFFQDNLRSKANSVAVSMRDSTALAALNEDYASLVSAGQNLVHGDPDLDFLVIAKNNGYAMIFDKKGWRVKQNIEKYWCPEKRNIFNEVEFVPLMKQMVFHHAQPFDYSGIQWGWIHVGLSLKNYNHNVANLYRNTVILGVICVAFSFLIALLYAGQLVRPILRLRYVVQQIANGDFSVRADVVRKDELGGLAKSVNIMTDALVQRNNILETVRYTAEQLVRSSRWEDVISTIIDKIGKAYDASHCYIFINHKDKSGRLLGSPLFQWKAKELSLSDQQEFQEFDYSCGLEKWRTLLGENKFIVGPVSRMSEGERAILEPCNMRSIAVIPIFVGEQWWGFFCLNDCFRDRSWPDIILDSLRTCTEMLGTTIARQGAQDDLINAKHTLEERVFERTHELQEEIIKKERVLIELGEAQSDLLKVSRAAGMAEVATSVLHNVGNVLNSANVSCTLIIEQLQKSRVSNILKVADLITTANSDQASFLINDPKGRQIPAYLISIAPVLEEERLNLLNEAKSLRNGIDHIKGIVAMQQSYGRISGVKQKINPEQLMEDAYTFNAAALSRNDIKVYRFFTSVPPVTVDKHKVLQILLNLISNAQHACISGGEQEKHIILRVFSPDRKILRMQVEDNGMGILPENMKRIFQHGFTTRQSGHGFGLHSGALAARELGGSLTVHSNGPGTGAVFTLDLPLFTQEEKHG